MKLRTPHLLICMLGLISVFLFSSCEEIIDPPQQSITAEEANILEEEFKETRARILNDTLGFVDTRDFWFSLDSLKRYIEYVEQEGKRMGKQNLGIRIYFAAYPPESNYPDPGFSTVFLAPTGQDPNNGLQKGFFPVEHHNQNLDSINALNFGHGGQPPNDY